MFADEPTGNLDSTTSGEILALLRDSVDTLGQTTVMVTHDAHAAAIADRVLFLADGDIVRDLGPSTRARDPRDARGGERAMIGVALKGLAGRKVRALLTALAVVIGVSMVSGTFILTDTMQKSFNGLFTASYGEDRRRHPRQGDRQGLHQRQRRHDPRIAARQGPGAARGRGRRRRRRPAEANVADIIGKDGKAVAKESVGGSYDAANARFSPFKLKTGKPPHGARRGRDRRRHRRRRSTTRSATRSSSSTLGKQHTYRISGTVSFGERRLARLRAASPPGTSRPRRRCSTARAATTRSRSPRSTAPRPRSSSQAIKPLAARRPRRSRTAPSRPKDDAEGAQRRHGDDPQRAARLRRHRAARRRVRDLQHPVDHGRPAHARVRDAADARRLAQAGHALGRARGLRDRPARLGDRARRSGFGIAKGMVALFSRARRRAARGRHGHRAAHDHRLAHRSAPASRCSRASCRRGGRPACRRSRRSARARRCRRRGSRRTRPRPGSACSLGVARRDRRRACSPAASAPALVGAAARRRRARAVRRASRCWRRGSSSRSPASWAGRRAAPAASPASWPAPTPSATRAGPRRPPPR